MRTIPSARCLKRSRLLLDAKEEPFSGFSQALGADTEARSSRCKPRRTSSVLLFANDFWDLRGKGTPSNVKTQMTMREFKLSWLKHQRSLSSSALGTPYVAARLGTAQLYLVTWLHGSCNQVASTTGYFVAAAQASALQRSTNHIWQRFYPGYCGVLFVAGSADLACLFWPVTAPHRLRLLCRCFALAPSLLSVPHVSAASSPADILYPFSSSAVVLFLPSAPSPRLVGLLKIITKCIFFLNALIRLKVGDMGLYKAVGD